jgi:hypothetical protein
LSGGWHLIYRIKPGTVVKNTVSKYADGLDTRGSNGYIILYGLDNTPMAECPDWLLQAVQSEPTENMGSNFKIQPGLAREMLREYCETVSAAPPGEANNTLNTCAFAAGNQIVATGSLSREEVFEALFNAAKARGKSDNEARATINSGLNGGVKAPAPVIPFEPVPVTNAMEVTDWLPSYPTLDMLKDRSFMKRPQNFKDFSPRDITLFTADGGTGKTTLLLNEAVCLALGKPFLGFDCLNIGKTLYLTGEDNPRKYYGLVGNICENMGLSDEEMQVVANSLVIKEERNMCVVSQDYGGFIIPNHNALNTLYKACDKMKPSMIVIDPISMFWGMEAALNDMTKAVAKFAAFLRDYSDAQIVIVNHMGKQSSQGKDLSQFSGRGGSALPSHSRIVRSMIKMDKDVWFEETGRPLDEHQTGIKLYTSKFSDGSPILDVGLNLLRTDKIFERVMDVKVKETEDTRPDTERVIELVLEFQRKNNPIIEKALPGILDISKERIQNVLNALRFRQFNGILIKSLPNPDVTSKDPILIAQDEMGNEIK